MLTNKEKKSIEAMYFADCPITVLDDPTQEAMDYYYSLMHMEGGDIQEDEFTEALLDQNEDDYLPW